MASGAAPAQAGSIKASEAAGPAVGHTGTHCWPCCREDAGEREDMTVDRSAAYDRDRASGPGPAKCKSHGRQVHAW